MERILQTLRDLRKYALDKGYEVALFYHEEDSYLMRFANSSISLNTNEHLIRLNFSAFSGRKRASYELITDLGKLDEMKQGIDIAAEMVRHAQPLTYQPTVPTFGRSFADESGYDATLAHVSNEDRLQYFNTATAGLETEAIKLSGIFSCGTNTIAQVNTHSDHSQFFRTSDAQVTAVLAHTTLKWEVTAEQSAHKRSDLDPSALQQELAFLLGHYQADAPQQIPLGSYAIVFGSAATADMLNFMNWIGFNGGSQKRGFSFLGEDKVGQKVFSGKITLVDDPNRLETFPFKSDYTGILRKPFTIFQNGVFRGFTWTQDDADEFGAKATGHTVGHKSLVLSAGDRQDVNSLQDLVNLPRKKDLSTSPSCTT